MGYDIYHYLNYYGITDKKLSDYENEIEINENTICMTKYIQHDNSDNYIFYDIQCFISSINNALTTKKDCTYAIYPIFHHYNFTNGFSKYIKDSIFKNNVINNKCIYIDVDKESYFNENLVNVQVLDIEEIEINNKPIYKYELKVNVDGYKYIGNKRRSYSDFENKNNWEKI